MRAYGAHIDIAMNSPESKRVRLTPRRLRRPLNLTLSDTVRKALQRAATQQQTSQSAIVERAVRRYLKIRPTT
jgi:hypothetical protein